MVPSRRVEDILTIITVQMSLVVVLNVPDHQETGRAKFFNAMSLAWKTHARHRATDCISQVSRHRDRSHKVPESLQLCKEGVSGEPPNSHNVEVEQPEGEL